MEHRLEREIERQSDDDDALDPVSRLADAAEDAMLWMTGFSDASAAAEVTKRLVDAVKAYKRSAEKIPYRL